MSDEVATAYVTLLPSAKGFAAATAAELSAPLAAAGATGGAKAGASAGKGMKSGLVGAAKGIGPALGITLGAAAAVGVAKGIVGAAANYEESQNVLQAAIGASGEDMVRLDKLAKDMGASTVYSALEASDAMIELGKAGLTVDQIMSGGIQSSMALGATEGLNLADAATAVANAMSAFGINARDLPGVADALAGASKSSTASVSSLMQALQQVGPGAKTAGLELDETVGILAAFDNMGLKGSDAGTSLKTMLTRLVPQTKKARDAFADYGLATYDAQKAVEALREIGLKPTSSSLEDVTKSLEGWYTAQGMSGQAASKAAEGFLWVEGFTNNFTNADGTFKSAAEMAGVLHEALNGLTEVEMTEALNTLFGDDASRAAGVLTSLGEIGLQPFISGAQESGTAAEMADARTKGFKGSVEALQGSLETLSTDIGTTVLPALTSVTDWMTTTGVPAVQGAVDAMQRNYTGIGRGIGTFAQWTLTWTGIVVGFWRSAYNIVYWFTQGILKAIDLLPFVNVQESLDRLYADNAAVNSWFDGVESDLASARTSVDGFMAHMDELDWKKQFEVSAKTLYYDPHTGTYYGGAAKGKNQEYDPLTSKPRPKPPKSPGRRSAGGSFTVTNNITVNNSKPERASDSTAAVMRRKTAVKGW